MNSDTGIGALTDEDMEDGDYGQLGEMNYAHDLVFTGKRPEFLRKAFMARWGVELFWLVCEDKTVLFFANEVNSRFYEDEEAAIWLGGFFAAFMAINDYRNPTFIPEPEENKDVHTEHCCVRHGCKYGYSNDFHAKKGRSCPVETGVKRQSFPCESCGNEIHEPW